MRILAGIVTVIVLALMGQAMRNAHWLIPIVPVAAVWLAYRLSSPYERREFRVFVPRLLRRLRLRGHGRRHRSIPAKQLPPPAALRVRRDD